MNRQTFSMAGRERIAMILIFGVFFLLAARLFKLQVFEHSAMYELAESNRIRIVPIEAKKGETLTLRFTRTTPSECLKAVAIPDLKIEKELPVNTPVDITITPDKEGKLVFQCWMAMVKGEINVSGS